MKVLVVPSNREENFKAFLNAWLPHVQTEWHEIILVEDNPEKTFDVGLTHHYCWQDIQRDLGRNHWIISRRDSAIRCYGFYKAWQMGAEYIFTLDDDCFPVAGHPFCNSHIKAIEECPRWMESIPGVRTRGMPYYNLGHQPRVVANMGLWQGIPDWDAIQQISGNVPDLKLPQKNYLIPRGQYFPFCGMNMAFKRRMTPAAYFPLMGEDSPYRRQDDIWFGVIFKKICDHLGFYVSAGPPFINHIRASNPMQNLVKEAPGIAFNETFWERIDEIPLKDSSAITCMHEIGVGLTTSNDNYLHRLGLAIQIWADLFKEN